jgi:hypothetical protein
VLHRTSSQTASKTAVVTLASWTDCQNSFECKLETLERCQPFRLSGLLAVLGSRVGQIEGGHRTDALG